MILSALLPIFQALGYTLVHFCWQGAVIAGLYALMQQARPNMRPAAHYVLGLCALVAMLGAAVLTFGYELARLSVETPALPHEVATSAQAEPSLSRWLPLIDAAWLAGVMVLSARMAAGLWRIRTLSQQAQAVPEAIQRRFDAALKRCGLSGKVGVRLNAHIDGPFVVGIMRAIVYLPLSAVSALTPDQLDAVFAHELEHVRRADYSWNLLQSVIETLFFYHPAVWWIGRSLREQRELCCDDAALHTCRDPLTYAQALLTLEEQRREPMFAGDLSMALNGHGSRAGLLARITRILGETPMKKPAKTMRTSALVPMALPVLLLAAATLALPVSHVAASPNAASPIHPKSMAISDAEAESPAPEATDADVAPSENSWDFVRDAVRAQARNSQWHKHMDEENVQLSAADIARIKAEAGRAANEAVRLHQPDIERAIEDAHRDAADMASKAMGTAEVEQLKALAQSHAQLAVNAKMLRQQAMLSQADMDEIKAEVRRAANEARAQAKEWKKEAKGWSWTSDDASIPPAPPPPPAAPRAPTPPLPPAPPQAPRAPLPPAAPAAPEARPVAMASPAASVIRIVLTNPAVAMKTAAAAIAADVRIVRSDDGRRTVVICKKTAVKTHVMTENRIELRTETTLN